MTVIQLKSKCGHKHLLADGHAGYSEAGTDIVCASVSILVQSFIYHCQLAEEKGKELKNNWDDTFKNLKIETDINIEIEKQGKLIQSIKEAQ